MNFIQHLKNIQQKQNSLLCVGLDTDIAKIPAQLRKAKNPQLAFNRIVIEQTCEFVCAYKLNLAFYEEAGLKGLEAIEETLKLIPRNVITIADGKRGDIGNTAQKQASTLLSKMNFDAVTINPYMGYDAVEPFIQNPIKGVFLLCLTSNPGSKDFQYLKISRKPFYQHVALKAKQWNKYFNIGVVVGATHISELKNLRFLLKDMPFLIPGVGEQKGDLENTVKYGCSKNGDLAVINISRSIIFVSENKTFYKDIRRAAVNYYSKINLYRSKYF